MLGWAAGSHGTSVILGALTFYLLHYMTGNLGIDVLVASQIIFLVRMYDLVTDPLMGYISDRTETSTGRRRPYLLAGAIGCFITFVALFNVPALSSGSLTIAYIVVVLLLFSTAYTVFNVPYLAMPPEMSADPHERTVLMSFRTVFFVTANLTLTLGGGAILSRYGDADGYAAMGWMVGSTVLLGLLLAYFSTRRVPFGRRTLAHGYTVSEQLLLIVRNRPFCIYIGAKLCLLIANASFSVAFLFFAEYALGRGPELMVSLGIFVTIGTLVALPIWASLARHFGKRNTLMTACLLYAATALTWLLASPDEPGLILNTRIAAIGFCSGGLIAIAFAMLPDVIEYDRIKSGINREGAYSGIYSAIEKIASAFGPLLFGGYLAAMGFVSSQGGERVVQEDATVSAIYVATGAIPAAAALCSAAFLYFYPLDERRLGS